LDVVLRVAHVEGMPDGLFGAIDHAHDRLDGVVDVAKGTVHLAAVDEYERLSLHQRRHERSEHTWLAIILSIHTGHVIHSRADPVVPVRRQLEAAIRGGN